MKNICLACYTEFIHHNKPFESYPYCPCCGSGKTAWVDENGNTHKNN